MSHEPGQGCRVAYLVNQYPKTSHSFVRREILALERLGAVVSRFAIRALDEPLVEAEDREEAGRTRTILDAGLPALFGATLRTLLTRPLRFLGALRLTLHLARWSDRGFVRPFAWLFEACLLRRWLQAERVEHVHAHFGSNSASVAMLVTALGGPGYSFTAHGTETFDSPPSVSLAEKIRRARFVVAVSDWGHAQLMRWSGPADWPKLCVVRCGVDERFLGGDPTPVPAERRVVCIARLSPEKGVEVLVEAMARLARKGVEGELVVVGDGALRASLTERIAAQGLGDRVRLFGWGDAEAVRREILAARALVLPSFMEGLPVVLMEAMALGRPVVATAVGAVPELARAHETGWLVPPGDPDALANAIAEVFEAEPERLGAMGARGAKLVRARHDAAQEAAGLLERFRLVEPS